MVKTLYSILHRSLDLTRLFTLAARRKRCLVLHPGVLLFRKRREQTENRHPIRRGSKAVPRRYQTNSRGGGPISGFFYCAAETKRLSRQESQKRRA